MIVFSSRYIVYLTSFVSINQKIKPILKNIKEIAKISNKEAYYCIERERFVASDDKSWIIWLVYYLLFPREQSLIPVERKYQFERKWLRFIILNMNTMKDDLTFAFKEMNCKKKHSMSFTLSVADLHTLFVLENILFSKHHFLLFEIIYLDQNFVEL